MFWRLDAADTRRELMNVWEGGAAAVSANSHALPLWKHGTCVRNF